MFSRKKRLERQYTRLLQKHGAKDPRTRFSQEAQRRFLARAAEANFEYARRLGLGRETVEMLERVFSDIAATGGFTDLLQRYSAEIENAMKALKTRQAKRALKRVFVGEFPTGSFNAQVMPAKGGSLLLVNTGLMMLIYQTAEIIVGSTAFETRGKVVDPHFSIRDAIDRTLTLLACYLLFEDSTKAPPSPRLSGATRQFAADFLREYTQKFALAHEYGHIAAGHLDKGRTRTLQTPVGPLEVLTKEWEEELEADMIAISIMPELIPTWTASSPLQELAQAIRIGTMAIAPLFFFELDMLVSEVSRCLSGEQEMGAISDHPPTELRVEAAWMVLQRQGWAEPARHYRHLIMTASDIRRNVVRIVENHGIEFLYRAMSTSALWDERRRSLLHN